MHTQNGETQSQEDFDVGGQMAWKAFETMFQERELDGGMGNDWG